LKRYFSEESGFVDYLKIEDVKIAIKDRFNWQNIQELLIQRKKRFIRKT
jgi:hypothetical protein